MLCCRLRTTQRKTADNLIVAVKKIISLKFVLLHRQYKELNTISRGLTTPQSPFKNNIQVDLGRFEMSFTNLDKSRKLMLLYAA